MTTDSPRLDAPAPRAPAPGVEPFAHFLSAIGHRVVRGAGTYWYDASKGFLLALPSHRLLTPEADELRALVRRAGCAGVRFTAPLEEPGKLSYQIVCDERDYALERLSANTRSKVRRGLRRCEVRPVPFDVIAAEGREADANTVARQSRGSRHGDTRWARYWQAAAATAGMEGWGAFADGKLAAFLVTVMIDDSVEFLLARSRDDCLDAYPNNALIYTVARTMLVERGVRQITFGLESLEPVGPLDQFKFGMGFRTAPLRQRIVFHPLAHAVLERRPVRALVHRWAAGRGGSDPFWRKADGLLRFAEQGGLGQVG